MMKLGYRGITLMLVAPVVACSDPLSPEQSELEQNLGLWQEVGPANYRYTFQRLCFCGEVRPVEIEVRAGAIVSVTIIETSEQLDASLFERYETVDDLFAVVQDALDRDAERLEVTYHPTLGYPTDIDVDYMVELAGCLDIDAGLPWSKLPAASRRLLLEGNTDTKLRIRTVFRNPRLLLDEARRHKTWPGLTTLLRFIERFVGSALEKYQQVSVCPGCRGARLSPVALAVRFHGLTIDTLAAMTVEDARAFFAGLELSSTEHIIGKDIFREIAGRLSFLEDVGVGYLSMDRRATTLSGGESQRIRLASQVGSGLQGVLYILDEPSIGESYPPYSPKDGAEFFG